MEALKLIDLAILSKKDAEGFRLSIVEKVENGEVDALRVNMAIAFLNKVFEGDDNKKNGLKHLTKEYAISEFDKYSQKQLEVSGFKIEKAETGVQYDCSQDAKWNELVTQEKEIAEKRKARESFLKALKEPTNIVDEDSGEMVKVFPAIKKSTTSLKFTLK